jgi:hypothetical protein
LGATEGGEEVEDGEMVSDGCCMKGEENVADMSGEVDVCWEGVNGGFQVGRRLAEVRESVEVEEKEYFMCYFDWQ